MKRIFFSFIIFLLTVSAFAQVKQEGRVLEYKFSDTEQKIPLRCAVPISVDGASSTVSNKKTGKFTLHFNTKKKGDGIVFEFAPRAYGYELMNARQLETWNINPAKPLEIVFCEQKKFYELVYKYYNISRSYISYKHKDDVCAAPGDNKAEISSVHNNNENILNHILQKYIERLLLIDRTNISTVEQSILKYVDSGNIDKAISRYNDLGVQFKIKKLETQIDSLNYNLDAESKIENLMAKRDSLLEILHREISVLVMGDEYNRAINLYDAEISISPNDVSLLDAKGELLLVQYRDNEALKIYNNILELYPKFFLKYESDFYKLLKERGLIQ